MRIRLIACFAAVPMAGAAGQPSLLWLEQFGSIDGDNAEGMVEDGAGGAFVCGDTYGSLGGPNAGGQDAWVARYDAAGQRLWIAQLGTGEAEHSYALAPDGAGGVFVGGPTWGDLGAPNKGMHDSFIARYDQAGHLLWVAQFGSSRDDQCDSLIPDGSGGVYAVGLIDGDLEEPPNDPSAGDAFLARFGADGSQLWLKQWGTDQHDEAGALVPDGAGGLLVCGGTGGNLYGPNAGPDGSWDAILARFDADGNQTWGIQFGSPDLDLAISMATAPGGGVFIAGATLGELGGPNAGAEDVFITRRDAQGGEVWTTQFGTSGTDVAIPLVTDGAGGVYTSGWTTGDLGGANLGHDDAFLAHHDGDGTLRSIVQFGTKTDDEALAMATDGAGGVILCGGTLGQLGAKHIGDQDAFIARFGPDCYPDCDGSGGLDLFDFLCFVNLFNDGDSAADCDGNGGLDLFDFLCFVNLFNAGC